MTVWPLATTANIAGPGHHPRTRNEGRLVGTENVVVAARVRVNEIMTMDTSSLETASPTENTTAAAAQPCSLPQSATCRPHLIIEGYRVETSVPPPSPIDAQA